MQRGMWRARFNRIGATALVATLPLFAIAPSVHAAADPDKVLRVAFEIAETGFDPAKVTDNYSVEVIRAVYERLLSYDYLARPVRLVPSTAEALPEITDNGRTYTLRVRQGIYFHPDLAFKGVRRELTAVDYAYSVKRFVDPAIRSPWKFLVEGKIAGLDALAKDAGPRKPFDYDAKVSGLEVVDRYTLRIRLNEADYNFAYILAMPQLSAVAREVSRDLRRGYECASGRHRPLHARELGAQIEDCARCQSRLSRSDLGFRGDRHAPRSRPWWRR